MATHDILEHAGQGQDETGSDGDEEDGGDVQSERDPGVGEEDKSADAFEVVERLETLDEEHDGKVDGGADGRVVVKRDQGVHLRDHERESRSVTSSFAWKT